MNPVTIKTGCQLNSASPPSQARPSLKWRTHLSTNIMETNPTAAAADSATRNCTRFSIAISVTAAAARSDLTAAAVDTTTAASSGGWWWGTDLGHMTQS